MNVDIKVLFIFIITLIKNVYSSPSDPKVKTHFFKWGGAKNSHLVEPPIPVNFIQNLRNLQIQPNGNPRWLPHEGLAFKGNQQEQATRLHGSPKLIFPVLQHQIYNKANRFAASFSNPIKLSTVRKLPTTAKVLKVKGYGNDKSNTGYSRVTAGNKKSSDFQIHSTLNRNRNSRPNSFVGSKHPQLRIPLQTFKSFKPVRKTNPKNMNRNSRPRIVVTPINMNLQNFHSRNSPSNKRPMTQFYSFSHDLNRNHPPNALGYRRSSQTSTGQYGSYSKNIGKNVFQRLPSQKTLLNDQIFNGSFFFLPKYPNYAFSYKPNELFRPKRPISMTDEYAGNFNDRRYWFPYPFFNTFIDLDWSNPNNGSKVKLVNGNTEVLKDFLVVSNVDELSHYEVENKSHILTLDNSRVPDFQYNLKPKTTSGQPEWLNNFKDRNIENGQDILIGFIHDSDLSKTNNAHNDNEFFQHRNTNNDVLNGGNNVPMTYDSEQENSNVPMTYNSEQENSNVPMTYDSEQENSNVPMTYDSEQEHSTSPPDEFESTSEISEANSFNSSLSPAALNMDQNNFTGRALKLPDVSVTNIVNVEVRLGDHPLVWQHNDTKKLILNKTLETLRNYKPEKQIFGNKTRIEILNKPQDQFSDDGLNIKLYLSLFTEGIDVSDIKVQNENKKEELLMTEQKAPVNEGNKTGIRQNNVISENLKSTLDDEDDNMFMIT